MSATEPVPPRANDAPVESGSFGMLRAFVRAYPLASALTLVALLLAGLLDGLGLSTLLSMLSLATDSAAEPSLPERVVLGFTALLGLEPGPGVLLGLAIVILSLKAAMMLLAKRQVGYAVANVATDLRLALIRACMRSRWSYYLSQPVGRLSNAVATEADRAAYGFRYGATMSAELINAFIYIVVAVLISWQATLVATIGAIALLAVLQILVRVASRAGRSQTQLLKSLLTLMTDQLGAVKPLKAMAREDHLDSLLGRQTEALRRALRRQVFSTEALVALQEPALAILVGAGFFILVVHLEMALAAAVVVLFLLARAVTLLAKSQRAWQNMAICESAYWSLAGAIRDAEAEREPPQGHLDPELTEAIEFDRVSFSHGRGSILHEQTLRIPAGGLTVITGPSGVGKTTLLDLVVGLLEPTEGTLRIDGVPFGDVDHHAWRRRIGYVPQDPLLVNDSVLRNLTLGEPGITAADAAAALRAADAWEFVQALPDGLETLVGERGGRLSGGQRQRLALARALIHRPRLLILDEFTSNLDPEAEAAVLATIAALRGRLTLLAVTHGTALLEIADQVLHMGAGNVSSLATARARREAKLRG